ncbi:MAG: 16S rRNA (guanine(527)-N(7))-methyltransferase RsmG [Thiohalocapsa sp.]
MAGVRPPPVAAEFDRSALHRRLDQGLVAMGPEMDAALDAPARDRLIAFLALLMRWNRAYNLTAVRDPAEMVPRHLLDSLAVLPWISRGPVLDAGTGAGLPGIPLAVARPELRFTLLDGNGKKARFVRQAVLELGLDNVEVVHSRLEAYRPAEKFATITARAVASLSDLLGRCAHLAAADARLLALKGRLPEQEIAALMDGASPSLSATEPIPSASGLPGGTAPTVSAAASASDHALASHWVHRLCVPQLDGERNLIEISFHATAHG